MVLLQADVVVCTANKNLDLRKGRASNVLLEAGGDSIQDECRSMYSEGIDYGEIAMVTGGNLSCKMVYFVALPVWSGGQTDRQVAYVFPRQKNFDFLKFTAFAIHKIEKKSQKLELTFGRVEKFVGKGENAGYHNVFKKGFFSRSLTLSQTNFRLFETERVCG